MAEEKSTTAAAPSRGGSVHSGAASSTSPTLHSESGQELEKKADPAPAPSGIENGDFGALEAAVEIPIPARFSWIRYTALNCYRRLFSLVFIGNLVAFIWVFVKSEKLVNCVNAAVANLMVVGLARQPLVINALFLIFCSIPRSTPLYIRRQAAKIYTYGGVHSGAGVASFMWYVGYIALLTKQYVHQDPNDPGAISKAVIGLSWVVFVLLLFIITAAYPTIRSAMHDYFELTHRFCGWIIVLLFWPLLILFSITNAHSQGQSLGTFLVNFPTFWFVIITTLAIIHPWVFLRKIPVRAETVSPHVVRLHFAHTHVNFGHGLALSKHPLRDWHSFATFPDTLTGAAKDAETFSCLVSKAGDWTGATIATPPTHLYKKAVPIYGFAYVMKVFRRVIVVATGSGIGPCLSYLGDPKRPEMRVLWQTRSPLKTYGQNILDYVHILDPNPVVIDSSKAGMRGDMLPLVIKLYRDFDAEAICIISNPFLTKKLTFECEARGIHAFGPIFDS